MMVLSWFIAVASFTRVAVCSSWVGRIN